MNRNFLYDIRLTKIRIKSKKYTIKETNSVPLGIQEKIHRLVNLNPKLLYGDENERLEGLVLYKIIESTGLRAAEAVSLQKRHFSKLV